MDTIHKAIFFTDISTMLDTTKLISNWKQYLITWNHSSRMSTARLASKCHYCLGLLQMRSNEQAQSPVMGTQCHHWGGWGWIGSPCAMSGAGQGWRVDMSYVWRESGPCVGLCIEVQFVMGNGHMGTHPLNRMTDTCKNITFLQLHWQAVIIAHCRKLMFSVVSTSQPFWIHRCRGSHMTITMMHWSSIYKHLVTFSGQDWRPVHFCSLQKSTSPISPGAWWLLKKRLASYWNAFLLISTITCLVFLHHWKYDKGFLHTRSMYTSVGLDIQLVKYSSFLTSR